MSDIFKYKKHKKVITCTEAVSARKIHLKQELKTILLSINNYFVAVHLRGSDNLDFRKIKKIFKVKNIIFMSEHQLKNKNLQKGIINPWNINFCIYNILCKNVFYNRFMATNAGVFDTGIYFKVDKLLELNNLIIHNIGKHNEYSTNCR